jgi:hypothetical protein
MNDDKPDVIWIHDGRIIRVSGPSTCPLHGVDPEYLLATPTRLHADELLELLETTKNWLLASQQYRDVAKALFGRIMLVLTAIDKASGKVEGMGA